MAKGVSEVSASLMLTVIFAGGAIGKLGCGILADKLGTTAMIVLTEALTGACLLALLPVDQMWLLPLLFCLGFFLNGTSSVLLDGVAELFDSAKRSRGYGLYFTIYLGSGAISPSLYGLVGDAMGLQERVRGYGPGLSGDCPPGWAVLSQPPAEPGVENHRMSRSSPPYTAANFVYGSLYGA